MKLNADILSKALKNDYSVSISGPRSFQLHLPRPEFYMEHSTSFLSDHLYLATAEHLPHRPRIEKNAVLVCIGDGAHLKYYSDRLCLILIRNKADFFKVYQALQAVYDRYDQWEKQIYMDLFMERDIHTLIDSSDQIFECPIYVLDQSFRFLASSRSSPEWQPTDGGILNAASMNSFMSSSRLLIEKKGAMVLDLDDTKTLCVNLFNEEDVYEGCLCLDMKDKVITKGEEKLAEFLAGIIEKAIDRYPQIINNEQSSVKSLMETLVNEMPLSSSQRWILNTLNHSVRYLAAAFRLTEHSGQMPAAYICDVFEETFPQSCAFSNGSLISGFINLDAWHETNTKETPEAHLKQFAEHLYLCAGVSNPFDDLFSIRIYYAQAESALENGAMMHQGESLYFFKDYALVEMIINSLGGLPAESYFPQGLKEIQQHDKAGGVSYMETLKVFLEENMSFTAASKRLFIHRSTLIDRIARIEKELCLNLHSPEERLLVEMLIKASEIEMKIREKS